MKTINVAVAPFGPDAGKKTMKLMRKIEYIFHALVCVMMMNAFFPFIRSMLGYQPGLLEGDLFQRTVLSAAYLLAMLAVCFQLKEVLAVMARTPAIWLLLLWAVLSVLWSGFPEIAFRRALAIWLTSLYGVVLALRFEAKQLLRLLGGALLAVMAGSLIMMVFFPQWAIMGPPLLGNWRGVFVHKNHLGRYSALAFLLSGYLFISCRAKAEKVFWALTALASQVTLIGSRSFSAMAVEAIVVVSAVFFELLFSRKKHRRLWLTLFVLAVIIVLFVLWVNFDRILVEQLDKDASLSGRIPLWRELVIKISGKPFLGYGYGTFWLGTAGPVADIWRILDWEVAHAHNGYLDLWLHLGFPGICLGLYLICRLWFMSVRQRLTVGSAGRFWSLFLVYFMSYNCVESIFLTANSLFWVMFVYGYAYLHSLHAQQATNGTAAGRLDLSGATCV